MAKRNAPGCCGCVTPTYYVYGCNNLALANYAYSIETTGGVQVATGTTGSAGQADLPSLASGDYLFIASRFAAFAFSYPLTANIGLNPAANYVCCPACAVPYPETIYLSGDGLNLTLTWGVQGAQNWSTSTTVDGSNVCGANASTGECLVGSGTFSVGFTLSCGGLDQFTLEQAFTGTNCVTGINVSSGLPIVDQTASYLQAGCSSQCCTEYDFAAAAYASANQSPCWPLDLTFNFSSSNNTSGISTLATPFLGPFTATE